MATRFADLAATSERLGSTTKRTEKVAVLSALLASLGVEEIAPTVAFLTGTTPHGRVGIGWATLAEVRRDVRLAPATHAELTVGEVSAAIDDLAAMSGAGVNTGRRNRLIDLLQRATESEQNLIVQILGGELRQGALDGVMAAAVADAAEVPVAAVRRAAMLGGDLGVAAQAALTGGRGALDSVSMRPGRAVQPMLASPAADVAEAFDSGNPSLVEWKLDGARVQVHRVDGEVSIFTRNLNAPSAGRRAAQRCRLA
jgi:DNA ligase-1